MWLLLMTKNNGLQVVIYDQNSDLQIVIYDKNNDLQIVIYDKNNGLQMVCQILNMKNNFDYIYDKFHKFTSSQIYFQLNIQKLWMYTYTMY